MGCGGRGGWMLSAADRGLGGAYNAVSRPGQATMASLLEAARDATGSRASLVWGSPEVIEAAGTEPWTELPIWAPPDGEPASLHDGDASAAHAAGSARRRAQQT